MLGNDSDPIDEVKLTEFFAILVKIPDIKKLLATAGMGEGGFAILEKQYTDTRSVYFGPDKVFERQVAKTLKAKPYFGTDQPNEVVKLMKQVFEECKKLKCGVCGLYGHSQGYCWVNSQIYGMCRSLGGEYQEANFMWRGGLKTRQDLKVEAAKAQARTKQRLIKTADAAGVAAIRWNKQSHKKKQKLESLVASVKAQGPALDQEVEQQLEKE